MTEQTEGEQFLGTAAAAERLNVSKATIIRRVHSGAIPIVGTVEGGGYVIRAAVIEALAAEAADNAVSGRD